ncbi:MAG: hypothetical protein HY537_11070 [Deltaproteobacteria bacterium]|nr:hypothetical protein [Deltaproteobacteria bacterium]
MLQNTQGAKVLYSCTNKSFVNAPAKVNLGLSLVGQTADGFHQLESLFWPIRLVDRIKLFQSKIDSVETSWDNKVPWKDRELPLPQDNLAYKALKGVPNNTRTPWKICIRKTIPIGGGLGGASSDAAAVVRFFSCLNLLSQHKGTALAKTLGADVPFFLSPKPAWVTGIGEKRRYLRIVPPDLKLHFLLVIPPFSINTREAFGWYRQKSPGFSEHKTFFMNGELNRENLLSYLASAKNDLEAVVGEKFPLIVQLIKKLRELPCVYAGLSGSGSTCFATFLDLHTLKKSAKEAEPFFRQYDCTSTTAGTYAE